MIKSQQPYTLIVVDRGHRVHGGSQMNYTRLILHGLSAIAVHADIIGVRLLLVVFGLIVCSLAGLATVAAIRFFTPLAIPGWATTAFGLIAVLLVQLAGLAVGFAFLTLQSRQSTAVIPIRDYRWFVRSVSTISLDAQRLDATVA